METRKKRGGQGRGGPGGTDAGPLPHVKSPIEAAFVLVRVGGVRPIDDIIESCAR